MAEAAGTLQEAREPVGDRFVGRADEIARVREVCGALVHGDGDGALVVVSGEAGIGKSRFCQEIATHLRGLGITVVAVRCWVDGGAPALWPWQPLLAELCGPAAAELLASDAGSSTVDPDRFARFAAVTDRLAEACERNPACVVIDDIHGADVGTLLLTRFVARSLQRLPLAIVLTRRTGTGEPVEDGPAARLLEQIESEAVLLALRHLDLDETTALLAAHGLRDLDPALVGTLHRVSGGNPLFLRRIAATGGTATDRGLPEGLTAAIEQAVDGVSGPTRQILRPVAVLGLTPSVAEAAAVAETSPAEVLDAVADATRAGLVVEPGREGADRFSFSHELVRWALERALGPAVRLDAHARAAGVVVGEHDGPSLAPEALARRAHHARAAASRSTADARVAVAACREAAASMVRLFAYEQADTLLSAAVELHQPPRLGAPPAALLVEWAQMALLCGRLTEARVRFDRAASAADQDADPVLFAEAALGLGGHWVDEHRTPVERARVLGLQRSAAARLPESEVALRCRLAARLAAETVYDGGSVEPVHHAVADARRLCGVSVALAEVLSLGHHALLTPEFSHSRLALADELIRVASEVGHGVLALMGLCWRAVDLFLVGDERAVRALEDLRERAEALGCQSILYILDAIDVMLLIRAGRLDEATKRAEACYELGVGVGEIDALGYLSAQVLAVHWIQGRDAELLDLAWDTAMSPTLVQVEFAFRATAALLAAHAGHVDQARGALDHLAADGLDALPRSSTWLTGMVAVVETAAALDDQDLAREAYRILLPYADLPVMPSLAVVCLGPTERPLGIAALSFGDVDLAVEHLHRAVAASRRLGNRPLAAISGAELAVALARRGAVGDAAAAADLLAASIEEAEHMGMTARGSAWRAAAAGLAVDAESRRGTIRREGKTWVVAVDQRQVLVGDMVGMAYLAELLTHPGAPIAALALAGGGPSMESGDAYPLLDGQARTAYSARARELTEELDDADTRGDVARAERTRAEIDHLVDQLEAATGLSGRARAFTSSHERARTAVRKAIKRAVDQIDEADHLIGELLRASVATGSTCVYQPDPRDAVTWSGSTTP